MCKSQFEGFLAGKKKMLLFALHDTKRIFKLMLFIFFFICVVNTVYSTYKPTEPWMDGCFVALLSQSATQPGRRQSFVAKLQNNIRVQCFLFPVVNNQ